MCWATNPNQSTYLTFQMSTNVVSSPSAYTTKIGVAIITSKGNAFVKESPFLQCFLNCICNSQRCFIFKASDIKQFRLYASIFSVKILYDNRKKFCRFVITAISGYSEIHDLMFFYIIQHTLNRRWSKYVIYDGFNLCASTRELLCSAGIRKYLCHQSGCAVVRFIT